MPHTMLMHRVHLKERVPIIATCLGYPRPKYISILPSIKRTDDFLLQEIYYLDQKKVYRESSSL